jgi:hypothetical protein
VQLVQFALDDLEHQFVRDEAYKQKRPDEKNTSSESRYHEKKSRYQPEFDIPQLSRAVANSPPDLTTSSASLPISLPCIISLRRTSPVEMKWRSYFWTRRAERVPLPEPYIIDASVMPIDIATIRGWSWGWFHSRESEGFGIFRSGHEVRGM